MTKLKRALIVIDVQNEYFTGRLPIEYPAPQTSLRNIGRAMDKATAAGVPVVVVQNSAPAGAPLLAVGSAGWQLHDEVMMRPRDHYVEKRLPSALTGTDLGGWVDRHAIDTLTLIGYMTHNCIASTALQALHAGLAVEVLSDAIGALPYANAAGHATAEEIHRVFCTVLQSRFGAVLDTDRWIEAVATGVPPLRENILTSYENARRLLEPHMDPVVASVQ